MPVLRCLAVACALALLPAGAANAAPAASFWTHAGHDAGNSAYNPSEATVNAGSINRVKQRWTVTPDAGMEGCAPALPPPLVAGGKLFTLDGDGVSAFDAGTGKRLWRAGKVFASQDWRRITVVDGVVLATGTSCFANSDPNGYLTALDAGTGAVRWQRTQEPPVNEVAAGDGVVVTSGAATATNEDTVSSYRLKDGRPGWTRTGHQLAGPVVADGRVLLTGPKGTSAVTAADGKVRWRSPARWSALAARDGRFTVHTESGSIASVSASNGKVAWSARDMGASVATDGRRVYAVAGTGVTALRAADGRRLWTRDLGGVPQRPVRAGGLLYVTLDGLPPAVLSPVDGTTVMPGGRFGAASGHVVVAAGRLYVSDGRNLRVYAP